ncbi:hypothetical protein ACM66B_005906 [Microbotryomycetes sp. NB124-2]
MSAPATRPSTGAVNGRTQSDGTTQTAPAASPSSAVAAQHPTPARPPKRPVSATESPEAAGAAGTKPKFKRNRAALSCTECKRRKIKCSRQIPCEACCKRREQDLCRWADQSIEVEPQPFTPVEAHEQLKARVAQLEAIILRLHGSQVFTDVPVHSSTADQRDDQSDPGGRDSDTEDAALVLEELALGKNLTRVGSRRRKIADNPFPGTRPTRGLADPTMSRHMKSLLVAKPEQRRKFVLDDIYESLPKKQMMDHLVQTYFTRADWAWHLHHRPTFEAEYAAFGQLLAAGRRDEVDPLWTAVLAMTCCLALNALDGPVNSPLVTITDEDLVMLPQKYCDAAQAALECGDWTGLPRVRTLQTIALFSPYFLYKGTPAIGLRHQTYLGVALRQCQQLGLHSMGHDPTVMPPEDVSLPPGINSLRREIPMRLFRNLLFVEQISLDKIKSVLPPDKINSAMPGNFDDNDLSAHSLVAPRPADVATDTSFDLQKWRIGALQREFNEKINGPTPLEYETTILGLDRGYREVLENLPTRFMPEYIPPLGEPLQVLWQRNMALQTINSRLLRLHRPFMSRGYRDPKYRTSTDSALQAARRVLVCQQSLDRAPLIKQGFQLLTIQGAIVVLCMDLWTTFPPNVTECPDWRLIVDVVPFFQRSLSYRQNSVRKIAQQSLNAISLLSQAIMARKEEAVRRVAAGGKWEDEGEVEPYGRLLKRTGASVSTTAAMGLDGFSAAASHIFSDRPHDFTKVVDGSQADPVDENGQAANTIELPALTSSQWNGPSIAVGSTFDIPNATETGPDWRPSGDISVDFDLSSLGGPEFASTEFSFDEWTTLDQFAATIGPNI